MSSPDAADCCSGTTRTYLDESFRRVNANSGFYLLAAVSLEVNAEETTRGELRKALPGRMPRFHWRTDSDKQHKKAIEAVARLDSLSMTVFVQAEVPERKQERHRQHALWNVAPKLGDRCQHTLIFEARERSQDRRDTKTLGSITKSGVGGPKFSYTFGRPLDEPLLWLPDIVLGATGLMLVGNSDRWWRKLPREPELIHIESP